MILRVGSMQLYVVAALVFKSHTGTPRPPLFVYMAAYASSLCLVMLLVVITYKSGVL